MSRVARFVGLIPRRHALLLRRADARGARALIAQIWVLFSPGIILILIPTAELRGKDRTAPVWLDLAVLVLGSLSLLVALAAVVLWRRARRRAAASPAEAN